MKQVGVIVKGGGLNHGESVAEAHLDGKRTRDCGCYIEVGVGDWEVGWRPFYEGYGKRFGAF